MQNVPFCNNEWHIVLNYIRLYEWFRLNLYFIWFNQYTKNDVWFKQYTSTGCLGVRIESYGEAVLEHSPKCANIIDEIHFIATVSNSRLICS